MLNFSKNNRVKLLKVVEDLLENISLDDSVIDTIQNVPMKTAAQISRLTECVEILEVGRGGTKHSYNLLHIVTVILYILKMCILCHSVHCTI